MRPLFPILTGLILCLFCGCTPQGSNANSTSENLSDSTKTIHLQVHQPVTGALISYPGVIVGEKSTIREVLQSAVKDFPEFSFTDTLYIGSGHLLTSIHGIQNEKGSEGHSWQFCIDNVASDRGIDEKTILPGQTLDWHYSEYGKLPCKKIGE